VLEYRLVAAYLQNVTAAHIHRSSTGAGVAFLYEASSPLDVHDRVVLASGTITDADLMEPTLTVKQLAAELLGGTSVYVNVHTAQCANGAISGDLLPQGGL
jgi:hypothetical protein